MSRPTITIDSTHLHSPSVTPNNNSTTTTTTTTSSSSSAADTSTAAVPRQQHARYPSASSSITSAPSSPRLVLGGGSIGSIGSSSSQKKNRSALRQFYGLTSAAAAAPGVGGEEAASAASAAASGELDSPEKPGMVDPVAYVDGLCKTADLRALLRVENELINEIRGLDGERKALVYDNYSKLISATDTIKKMRSSMEPLTPATSTLEPAISHIAQISTSLASTIQSIRPSPPPPSSSSAADPAVLLKKKKKTVKWVLAAPERVQRLVRDGKTDEAQREWAAATTLLEKWGDDVRGVRELREQGDKALSGM